MIFIQLAIFVFLLSLIFIIGHIISILTFPKALRKAPFESVFVKSLFGLISSITLFSVFKTTGSSVFSILIPLFTVAGYAKKNELPHLSKCRFTWPSISEWKVLALLFLITLPLLIWKNHCLYHHDFPFPVVINSDSIYHTNISLYIQEFGIENLSCNRIFPPSGTYPYHYFEAWVIALINSIFNFNPWFITECIAHPFLVLMVSSSLLALFAFFKVLNIYTIVIAGSAVVFSGLFFPSLAQNFWLLNFQGTNAYEYNALDEYWGLKLVVAYLLTASTLYFQVKRQLVLSICFLLILPIAPAILLATLVYLLVEIFWIKKFSWRDQSYSLVLWFTATLGLILFYKISGSKVEYIAIPDYLFYLERFFTIQQIKINISLFLVRSGQVLFVYSPIILLLVGVGLSVKRKELFSILSPLKGLAVLLVLVFFFSLMLWLFVEGSFGSKTYYFYSSLPFLNLFSIALIGIIGVRASTQKVKSIIALVYLIALGYYFNRTYTIYEKDLVERWQIYDPQYMLEIFELKDEIKGFKGGKLEGVETFSRVYNDNLDPFGFFILGFYDNRSDFKGLTSLSVLHADTTSMKEVLNIGYIKNMPLYQYAQQRWAEYPKESLEDIQGKFILDHKIKYIIAEADAPDLSRILKWAKKVIIDPKSQVTFVLLDWNKVNF